MITGILILAATLIVIGASWWAYRRGRDSARLDDAERSLSAAREDRVIDDDVDKLDSDTLRRRAARRVRKP